MRSGARTPEELETLLEDALLVGDRDAFGALFEPTAVVLAGGRSARGEEIEVLLAGLSETGFTYLAGPELVLQARDLALIVAGRATSVVHRDAAARWRYAITAIDTKGIHP